MLTPTWENDPIWLAYFWNGLVQPPTGQIIIISICLFVEVGSWSHYLQGFYTIQKVVFRSVTDGRPCPKALTFELRVGMMSRVRNTQRKLQQKNGRAWLYCRSFVVGLLVWLFDCFVLCCVVLLVWLFVSNGFGGTCKKDRRSLFGGGMLWLTSLRDGNARSKLDLDYPGSHLRKPENHSAVGAVKGFMGQCKRSEFWSWWEGKSHKIWAERYFPRKVQKAIAGTQNDGSGRWSGFLFEMAPFWATCLSFLGR